MTEMLIGHLLNLGYPSECMLMDMNLGRWLGARYLRADLVVVGQGRKVPIAVFEEKSRRTPESIRNAVSQLFRCQSLLSVPARLFMVFPPKSGETLDFYEITDSDEKTPEKIARDIEKYRVVRFPTYERLSIGLESKYELAQQERHEDRCDELKPFSRILAVLLFSVFLADFMFAKLRLSVQSAVILAMSVLVALLPYYDTIMIKDVRLTRKIKQEERDG